MSDITSVTTLQELVNFLSEFMQTVPTQEYVEQELSKKISSVELDNLIPNFVNKNVFNQLLASKASKAELLSVAAGKADQSEVSTGIARKANLNSLYSLEAKVNKLFPFKTVESIEERNALTGIDKQKIIFVVDASADRANLSGDAMGAIYAFSTVQNKWILQSEIKFSAEVISYINILGRPTSSAAEIDTVVGVVVEKVSLIRRLQEVFTKMHTHDSSLENIELTVHNNHQHVLLPLAIEVRDTDTITLVREGTMINVTLATLKAYMNN